MSALKQFLASDNCAPASPAILQSFAEANAGHVIGYGDDDYTAGAQALFRKIFGAESQCVFVYNGTAANILVVKALLKAYESVIAPSVAHINEDECGGVESIAGLKIEATAHTRGKISARDIPAYLGRRGFIHSVQPKLLSITQSNELGQCYSIDEMQAIGRSCAEHNLYFHVDGARIANAVAFLLMEAEPNWDGLSSTALVARGREILAAITVDAGVDALSLGGTKNGLVFGEAALFMNKAGSIDDLLLHQKQMAQLASKMRYIAIQYREMFKEDLWLRNALQANRMALYLKSGIENAVAQKSTPAQNIAQARILYPVEANAVFVQLEPQIARPLQEQYKFYGWGQTSYRLMCSWNTTEHFIDGFVQDLSGLL